MVSRALGPRPSTVLSGSAAGWAVLITCWSLVALCGLIWAAARLAARITGGTVESFGIKFAGDVLHGRTGRAWPHTPTVAVSVTAVLLIGCIAALVVAAGRVLARWRPAPGDPVAALARNPRMRALTRLPIARAAAGLRRSLTGADPRLVDPAEAGLVLGRLLRPAGRPGGGGPAGSAAPESVSVGPKAAWTSATTASWSRLPAAATTRCGGVYRAT